MNGARFAIRPLAGAQHALEAAVGLAPYLARLARRRADTADHLRAGASPAALAAAAVAHAAAAGEDMSADALPEGTAGRALRQAKADLHLAVAAGDLSGCMDLDAVTGSLSDLADAALASALALAVRNAPERDRPLWSGDDQPPGLFIVAMGKHGARELNYSSDVDLAAFYDRDAFALADREAAGGACVRVVQAVTRMVDAITPDGYVFRLDWRLRPDPGSTQLAVSVRAAEAYYESVGQNWERAAWIKARAAAGDPRAAAAFIAGMQPFIWRRHLDFAAIADIQSILRQIHAVRRSTDLTDPAFDVKLGRGGIREIEFFAQTQQLILGGREPALRPARTLDALGALAAAGRIDTATARALSDAYRFLRAVEHRIQMLEDEQTHKLPADPESRARVAALCGADDLAAFDSAVRACREETRARIAELFPDSQPLSAAGGSLVFTGVEDDPETLATLGRLGFIDPADVARTIRAWHHGRVAATRTARARELLTALTPDLLEAMAATGAPDLGFARFRDFFAALPAGVQILSLFRAEPGLLRETCATLALSPVLGAELARRPALIDSMLSPRFHAPVASGPVAGTPALLVRAVEAAARHEDKLDAARRVHREEAFRIGTQILHGRIDAAAAGPAFTELAEAAVAALLPVARAALVEAHGDLPGRVAVCGLGKLGGRELAADSDLDLMVVYDPDDPDAESGGTRPLSGEAWHARLTQRLVAALSAPTGEGRLYEVDMQLRPSGRAGPVAVRLSALRRYHLGGQAWLWERQALTRLRAVAGDTALGREIHALVGEALALPLPEGWRGEIAAMRDRMRQAHPPRGPWDVKRGPGGLIDLEFLVQAGILDGAAAGADVVRTSTLDAMSALAEAGLMARETAARLALAGRVLHDARQFFAVSAGHGLDLDTAPDVLKVAFARLMREPDHARARARFHEARGLIAAAWSDFSGRATEPPA